MSHSLKHLLKLVVPPVLWPLARMGKKAVISFSGDYDSWEEATSASTGYDAAGILERVALATRKVVDGEAAYERDSVVFGSVEYSWPLLAALLQVALERQSLRVIDFGGALGSTWRQNRKFLQRLSMPVSWRVVEQQEFVARGKEQFTDAVLGFDFDIHSAASNGADVVLFCSSLCYVPDPSVYLREAYASPAQYLIIDRLPVIPGSRDRIAVQKVTEPIYDASYPVRFFAEDRLFGHWLSDWRTIERWDCDLQPDRDSRSCGVFMEKK